MLNPILKNRKYSIGYIVSWNTVMIFQVFMMVYYYSNSFTIALSESLVFNLLFAIIGIGIWYPVYYTDLEKNRIINFLTNHLASSSLAVGLWLWLGYLILTSFFSDDVEYIKQLSNTIPSRVGFGFLYYVLLILIYYLFIYYENFKEKLVRESELKTLVKESELSSLKSQINPHFLFNSLNSISSLTMISPERAQDMVINLSEFLRYSLSNKKEFLTSFEEELKNIERYLKIEKIRFGKRLQVEQNIEENTKTMLLPGLILQPIVENAIKYGVYESIDQSDINIESRQNNELLEVVVCNDYDSDFLEKKGAGIGLKNVMSRLKIQYGRDDLVKISKTENTFKITLRFPQEI
ncbi:MAG: histidine kinase [Bacteroidales bacterium]|nr:histidine kinase [Bacteroidales bacterium]MBN2819512.1 histidine kinase [Bacteroidales bacterium]